MSTLTKEQIQNLTPEQQEALASFTLSEAKRRTLLLVKTRHHGWQTWIASLMPAVLVSAFLFWHGWTIPESDRLVLLAVIAITSGTAQWQVTAMNRRLNALIELLETDLRRQKATDGP
jgi:CHASE2 domain-containing sensor protein